MATKGTYSTLSQARDPRIPGLLVRNEWVGSYEEFEEAVEYGELRQFLGVETVAAPQPKPETPAQPAGSGRERIPPAPTLMATPSVASKSAYSEDADYMLSELLPQGTTISDADVDSLLKELEKPLKRTPRRTYTPSSRTAPPSVPSTASTSASMSDHARYEPGTRNLVEEAARAIGVEPKPRGPAPRVKLNRRPLQEIMEERRARQAETEHARRNEELFASLGLADAQINDEDAEAFLRDGTIPEVQRKKTSPVPKAVSASQQQEASQPEVPGPDDALAAEQAKESAATTPPVLDKATDESTDAIETGKDEAEVAEAPDVTKDATLTDETAKPDAAVEVEAPSDATHVPEETPDTSLSGDARVSARKSLQERLRKSVHLTGTTARSDEPDESSEAVGDETAEKSFEDVSRSASTAPVSDDMSATPVDAPESAAEDTAGQEPSTADVSDQDQQGANVSQEEPVADEPDAPVEADASLDVSRSADVLDGKPEGADATPSTDAGVERATEDEGEPTDVSSSTDALNSANVSKGTQDISAVTPSADDIQDKSASIQPDTETEANTSLKSSRTEDLPEAMDERAAVADHEEAPVSQTPSTEPIGKELSAQEKDEVPSVSADPTSSLETGTALHQETTELGESTGNADLPGLQSTGKDDAVMTTAEQKGDETSLSAASVAQTSEGIHVSDIAAKDTTQDEASPGQAPASGTEHMDEHAGDSVGARTDERADERTAQSELSSGTPAAPSNDPDGPVDELTKSLDKVHVDETPALEEPLGTQMLADESGVEPPAANASDQNLSDGATQSSILGRLDGLEEEPMPTERHTLEPPLTGTTLADEADSQRSDVEVPPAEGETGPSLVSAMAELDVPADHTRHPLEEPLSDTQLSKNEQDTEQMGREATEVSQGAEAQRLVGDTGESPAEEAGDAASPSQEATTATNATQDVPPPLPPKDVSSLSGTSATSMPSQDKNVSEDKAWSVVAPSGSTRQAVDVPMPGAPKVEPQTAGATETGNPAGATEPTDLPEKANLPGSTETASVPRSTLDEPADSPVEGQEATESTQDLLSGAGKTQAATPSLTPEQADTSLSKTEPVSTALAESSVPDEAEASMSQDTAELAAPHATETDAPSSSVERAPSSEPTTDGSALPKADPTPSTHPSTASPHRTSHTHFHQGHTHWNNEQDLDEAVLAAPRGPQATHLDDRATLDHFAGSDGHVRDRLRGIQRSDSFQHGMRHLGHGATKEQERVALHQTLDRFSSLEPPLQAEHAVPRSPNMAASTDVSRQALELALDAGAAPRNADASASTLPEATRRAAEQPQHRASPPPDRRYVSEDASPEEERVAVHQVVDRFSALEPPLHATTTPHSPQPTAPDARPVSADASAEEERVAVHQVVDRFSGLEPPLHETSTPRSPQPSVRDARHVWDGASAEEERIAVHQVVDRFSALEPPLHVTSGGDESGVSSHMPSVRDPHETSRITQHQVVDRFSALEPPLHERSADESSGAPTSATQPTSYLSGNEPDSSEGEDDDDVPDLWVSNPSRASQALHRHSGVDSDWDAQASDMSGSVDEAVRAPVDLGRLDATQRTEVHDEERPQEASSAPHSASTRATDESESEYSQEEESADNTPEHIVVAGTPAPLTTPPGSQDAKGEADPASHASKGPDRDTDTPKLERDAPPSTAAVRDLSGVSPPTPTKPAPVAKQAQPSTPQHTDEVRHAAASTEPPTAEPAHDSEASKAPPADTSSATLRGPTATPSDAPSGAPPMQRTPSFGSRDAPSGEADVFGTVPHLSTPPRAPSLPARSPRSGASPSLRSLRTPTRRTPEARSAVPKFLLDTTPPSAAAPPPRSPTGVPQNTPPMQDDWLMQDSPRAAPDASRADLSSERDLPPIPAQVPSEQAKGSADVSTPALPPRKNTTDLAPAGVATPSVSQSTEVNAPTPSKRPVPPVPTTQAPPSAVADASGDTAPADSPRPSTEAAAPSDAPATDAKRAPRPDPASEPTEASGTPPPAGPSAPMPRTTSTASHGTSTASSATEDDEQRGPSGPTTEKRRSVSGTQAKRTPIPNVRSTSGTQRPGGHRKTLSAIMQEADAFLQEWKD